MWRLLRKLWISFKDVSDNPLKIQSVHTDKKTGVAILSIQIAGKSAGEIKREPLDLLKENNKLNSFSKDDFNKIIDTLLKNHKALIEKKYKPNFILLRHQYSEHINESLLIYKDMTKEQVYIKPAKEVYANCSLIGKFDPLDALCIGYLVGATDVNDIPSEANNIFKLDNLNSRS